LLETLYSGDICLDHISDIHELISALLQNFCHKKQESWRLI